MKELPWSEFKQLLTPGQAFTYVQRADCIEIFTQKAGWNFSCQVINGSGCYNDFVDNYSQGAA